MVNILKAVMGVAWFVLAALITYKVYYIVPVLYGVMEITLMKVLFLMGLIIIWAMVMLAVPVYCIIGGLTEKTEEEQ